MLNIRPRPRKSTLVPPPKRRKTNPAIEEINFDFNARSDYLTGFHKRKLERVKRAQEEAAKKEREEKILMRKQLREERKKELEEHVEAVNALLEIDRTGSRSDDDSEESAWEGCGGDEERREVADHEEEYVDEDRFTVVTVEGVDVTKEGLKRTAEESEEEDAAEKKKKYQEVEGTTEKGKKIWPKKVKKKAFRYESKAERKLSRAKQKAGNKAKASARRGDD